MLQYREHHSIIVSIFTSDDWSNHNNYIITFNNKVNCMKAGYNHLIAAIILLAAMFISQMQ